jgi:cell wall-associated NlpC family hydrolase
MTPAQRTAIVAEAETWLRTPYHSNAAIKGCGVDCAMMPLEVYKTVLPLPAVPLPKYVQEMNLHRSEESYLAYVRELGAIEISEAELQPGDFALWKLGRIYFHGAIVTAWPKIIHAVNGGCRPGVTRGDAVRDPLLNPVRTTKPLFFTF